MTDQNSGQGAPQDGQLGDPNYTFNPNEHLMDIKSRNGASKYLPVQWRLVWFRSLCPNGTIETEIVHLDLDRETEEETFAWNSKTRLSEKVVKRAPGFAVFRAIVKDGNGGIAIGTKSEKAASFPDYIEKSETGAIGRALAALGYGTQFAGDEFDEKHRIVDAPVERQGQEEHTNPVGKTGTSTSRAVISTTGSGSSSKGTGTGYQPKKEESRQSEEKDPNAPMTEQQWASIKKLCQHLGKAEPQQTDIVNHVAAKEMLAQLSQDYKLSRSKSS